MNRELEKGYKFSVSEVKGSFEIKEIIGRGASCVVYRAEFTDEHGNITEHLLKEYNPKSIELYRDNDGEFCVENTDEQDVFDAGLECFKLGYEKQMHIRRTIDELKNSTSNIQGVYRANGTQYIDMTCFNGVTYSKVQEKSLYELLRRMKALTQVIGNYHIAGFLHLDIKPDNIFTIPETSELVMLFDFDSVTEKDNIGNKAVLSYTKSWAAPEQISGKHEKICEATDLFAIGEIIFFEIFGNHSVPSEHRRSFSKYEFNYNAPIFENANPKVYPLLTELFHRTICTAVDKRFQSEDELVELLDRLITLADPKAPFIKSSLPEPQNFFVGREREIDEIHAHLNDNRILFVNGVGGIGKSELVKQYAKKYKSEYDAVIFAPYVNDMNMLISDDGTVPVYNLFQYPAEQPAEYTQRKWRKLKELCDENTLIIVDNLDKDDDPDLNKLLELGCKFLITTRVDFSEYGYEQLSLDSLASREEINAIFNEYYKKPLDEKSKGCVDEIIDIVGGHTMTVELLAKQMTAGRITPEKMLSKLKEGGISDSGSERVRTGKDGVLSTRSAYDHIRALFDVSELEKEEIYILANLSLMPHTGVSAVFFHDLCELESYDDINELILNGWIRCDREKDFISLHPVVGDLAFDLLNEREVDISVCVNNLTEIVEEDAFEKIGLESREKFAYFLYDISLKVIQIDEPFEAVSVFLLKSSSCFKGFTDFKQAIVCCNIALEIMLSLHSDKHIKTAAIYDELASLYRVDGDFELSKKHFIKALEIRKNVYGGEHSDTATSYGCLGTLYHELGDFKKAEEYYVKALEIRRNVYGGEHSDTATSYNNLGALYKELDDFKKAEEYFIKALEIRKNVYGGEHSDTATSYGYLGTLYYELGDFKKAEEYYVKALEIRRNVYGGEHNDTATSYNNLGDLYKEHGDFKKAEEYFVKALEIRKNIYGDEHKTTAISYNKLGALYKELDDLKKAEEYYVKALEIRKKVYGDEHKTTATSYNNLGALYKELDDFKKAEEYYVKALEIRKNIYGDEHKTTAISYNKLGALYKELGDLKKAEEYYVKALEIRKNIYGGEHSDTATSYGCLGTLYHELGDLKKAEEYYVKALEIRKKVYGDEHKTTATSYNNLGALYKELDDFKKAEEYFIKALEIRKNVYGGEHVVVGSDYLNLGVYYRDENRLQIATDYLLKAISIFSSAYGDNCSKVAFASSAIGFLYKKQNNLLKAEMYLLKALKIRKKIYGLEHPKTALSYFRVGEVYNKMRKYNKAVEYYETSLKFNNKLWGINNIKTIISKNKVEEMHMIKVMNDACEQLIGHIKIPDHKNRICKFDFVQCPDQIVGKIKILNENGTYFVEYIDIPENITFDAENVCCYNKNKEIYQSDNERCILILESPHTTEYKINNGDKEALGPAKGATGNNIRSYFSDLLATALNNKKVVAKIKKNSSKTFDLVLMNSVQFQCSLEYKTTLYRDAMFHLCWQQDKTVSNFKTRLKNTSTKSSIVINCCTKGNHAESILKRKGILETKDIEKLELPNNLNSYELRDLVGSVIKDTLTHNNIYSCEHPYKWFSPHIEIK